MVDRVPTLDPPQFARRAGLRYITDAAPGIRRRRCGRGFTYFWPSGDRVTDPEERARLKSLAVPPAWTDVWMCPDPRGHLQATGRDARGRKQYRYHPDWVRLRSLANFDRMLAFGEALPRLRRGVRRRLRKEGLPREKVLAALVLLLEKTLLRVGNREYAERNDSYGITTLQPEHVTVKGARLRFRFTGKGGKATDVSLESQRLARVVRACRRIPGQHLFCWMDDGRRHPVHSHDVNDFLSALADVDVTAKDFRTWGGTVRAFGLFEEAGPPESRTEGERTVVRVIKEVAAHLGNTPAVCRKHYVHPAIPDAFLDGALFDLDLPPRRHTTVSHGRSEQGVLALLRRAASRRGRCGRSR